MEEEEESDEDSEEENPAEERDFSENELVLQLLHLLRISLEVQKIENVKIALRELVSQSRFVKMQESAPNQMQTLFNSVGCFQTIVQLFISNVTLMLLMSVNSGASD